MSDNKKQDSPRRKTRTPGAKINRICLIAVLVLFAAVAALNLFQFNRPTVSEAENRTLAAWPEFSWKALGDGTYFSGVSDFLKDTFWQRDKLIRFASALDEYKGFTYTLNGEKYQFFGQGDPIDPVSSGEERTVPEFSVPDFTLPVPTTEAPATTDVPATTDAPGTTDAPSSGGDVSTQTPETTAEPFAYVSVKLNQTTASMPAESMLSLNAVIETRGEGTPAPVTWTVSDPTLLTLTPDGNSAILLSLKKGTATVTASVGGISAVCTVTVTEKQKQDDRPLQEIQGNVFAYGGAIYQKCSLSDTYAGNLGTGYSRLCLYYKSLFPDAVVTYLPTPLATIGLDTVSLKKAGDDQLHGFEVLGSKIDPAVNFVNVAPALKAHADEYIYFNTDHHWTQLGAYYAYAEFAKSRGLTPTPLSAFGSKLVTDKYTGSYATYLSSYNIAKDELRVYYPTKDHKMTIYYTPNDLKANPGLPPTATYNSCIMDWMWKSYLCFISGDRPLVTIKVPANSVENGGTGKTVLVVKDSFGDAFAPFLCEHYETIHVVDQRWFLSTFPGQTLQSHFKNEKIDDVIITLNIMMHDSFLSNCWKIVGVQ